MQAFAPSDYTPMDGAPQNEEELDGILTIWMEEYNKQRDDLNLNVRAAVERHILELACEMGFPLGGQQPTNYRDVMSIVKSKDKLAWRNRKKEDATILVQSEVWGVQGRKYFMDNQVRAGMED
jgi:hypothetical protein